MICRLFDRNPTGWNLVLLLMFNIVQSVYDLDKGDDVFNMCANEGMIRVRDGKVELSFPHGGVLKLPSGKYKFQPSGEITVYNLPKRTYMFGPKGVKIN